MERYQVVVIGGGSAGMTAAAGAANLGAKTALIEKKNSLGGDCLHYGCVPSKSLIDAANRIYTMKNSAEIFGFSLSGKLEFNKVKEHVKSAQSVIQEHDGNKRFTDLGVDLFFGAAHFQSPNEISIGDKQIIWAEKVIIATGSSPVVPSSIEGIEQIRYVTNETIFDLEELPKELGVIGGGTIGLEMAQAFARMGTKVTVFEGSDQLFAKEDHDISTFMYNLLKEEINIELYSSVTKVENTEGKIKVHIALRNGEEKEYTVDQLLVSAGRKPNTSSLKLSQAGVATVKDFIEIDDSFRSSQPHIFAVGDAINTLPFTHAAGEEAKTVISNVLFGLKNTLNHEFTPWVTFTSPEVFHVGKTEKQVKEAGTSYRVYRAHLEEVDRFITSHETRGFVKIITDKRGTILGAHAAGLEAGEWMQIVVFAMKNKKKIGSLSRMIYSYPTKAGALQRAADVYWREKLFDGPLPKLTKKFFDIKYAITGKKLDLPPEEPAPASISLDRN
ncbi:NAD(P)/FAD-dependent oxidoreductase [Jeotgalibacillus sp. S-D1]|uniref:dihydrolipoyl dehydrogenase family protein n=1 Tax=Jeotgalibacillus sp. S-D1 TaxID=2552189 RepID=UPI00105A169F|nr:NAD(P)/FAD-dependent oxidoreductase [Jeotgalibacillus sp. S-D1]TDL34917.1 NAD(P)/FAD-dependent oxidoreductase [Jeotgalibacillus sp. S-D1]